ncbi:MAG: hypothetical protein EZS28_030882, partial [Streblomastix strix]
SARHVPGKENTVADSLSRLETSGDYMINPEILAEALDQLQVRPSIDVFANRRNRQCKRFCSLIADPWAVKQDGLSLAWNKEVPLIHPPIPLIQRSLNKISNEGCLAVFIHPRWTAQPCGRQNEKEKKTSAPRLAVDLNTRRKEGEKVFKTELEQRGLNETSIERAICGWHCIWRRYRQRIGQFKEYWDKSGRDLIEIKDLKDPEVEMINYIDFLIEQNSTPANIVENVSAIITLFKAAGLSEQKIYGKILKQVLKRTRAKLKKPIKETTSYSINILLKFIELQADKLQTLTEAQFLGCTFISIMAFCTLRMVVVLRADVYQNEDNSWNINTSMWKGDDTNAEITFRPLVKQSICPTFWLSKWLNRTERQQLDKPLWWLKRTNKPATEEFTSKSIHYVMEQAGVENNPAVTSFRAASILKAFFLGFSKIAIDRFSRHSDSSMVTLKSYDKNNNDEVRKEISKL